jgi:hypothetical protein
MADGLVVDWPTLHTVVDPGSGYVISGTVTYDWVSLGRTRSATMLDGECHLDFYVNSEVIYSGYWCRASARENYWRGVSIQLRDGDHCDRCYRVRTRSLSAAFMMTLEVIG